MTNCSYSYYRLKYTAHVIINQGINHELSSFHIHLAILILWNQIQWFLFAVERTVDVHDFTEVLCQLSLLYQLHHPHSLSDLETVSLLFPHEGELHVQFLPLSNILLAPLFVFTLLSILFSNSVSFFSKISKRKSSISLANLLILKTTRLRSNVYFLS
jgi:hypothetical protein